MLSVSFVSSFMSTVRFMHGCWLSVRCYFRWHYRLAEEMGTPRECDDDADAALDYLNTEGGISIGLSPRVLVRGRYEGEGVVLHFRRRYEEGTYLHVELKHGEEHVCYAVLDMCYPYGMAKNVERAAAYDGVWRQTRKDMKTKCHSWMGFGYTAGPNADYVDCAEHVFPCSVGYGYHSAECAKNVSGEWNWCSGGSTCGRKVWMFELSVFETIDKQLGREKLAVELTYILFNKDDEGKQKVEIQVAVNGVNKGSVESKDKKDTSLGHYDKGLLKKSATLFVSSKRHEVRKPHPPSIPSYLMQVYKAPDTFTGAPRIQTDIRETEKQAMMRCLIQLFNGSEAFNLSLLMKVLYDQVGGDSTRWDFIDELHALLNREGETRTMANILGNLSDLPPADLPYDDQGNYPSLLKLLLRLLVSLKHAVAWGKMEAEIRSFVRKTFEMNTSWVPVEGCNVCEFRPVGGVREWHFPEFVLQSQQDYQGGVFDMAAAMKARIENQRKIHTCKRMLRCR